MSLMGRARRPCDNTKRINLVQITKIYQLGQNECGKI